MGYVRMVITYDKSMAQPRKVANPGRGQLNRENGYSLSLFAPENFVSRDGFSRPVPRQSARLNTRGESGAYLRDSSRFPRRRLFIYLNHHTPSGQSRTNRVTQLRTDGVHKAPVAPSRSLQEGSMEPPWVWLKPSAPATLS